jgi:predicted nuclease with TOPRIM domain
MATAIPPLALDADMLQWQTKCAAAEEKAEDLQRQLQELLRPDAEDLERKVERLQKENEVLQRRNLQKQRVLDARWKALSDAKVEKSVMQRELDGVNKTVNQINRLNSTLTHQNKMDEDAMGGMKTRMETAENELERLKRKRADSTSPERVVTSILKRPAASSPTGTDRMLLLPLLSQLPRS